jgi:hypothetical protein
MMAFFLLFSLQKRKLGFMIYMIAKMLLDNGDGLGLVALTLH